MQRIRRLCKLSYIICALCSSVRETFRYNFPSSVDIGEGEGTQRRRKVNNHYGININIEIGRKVTRNRWKVFIHIFTRMQEKTVRLLFKQNIRLFIYLLEIGEVVFNHCKFSTCFDISCRSCLKLLLKFSISLSSQTSISRHAWNTAPLPHYNIHLAISSHQGENRRLTNTFHKIFFIYYAMGFRIFSSWNLLHKH